MISLYAHGGLGVHEVGKYNMTLKGATASFLAICSKHKLVPTQVVDQGDKIIVYLWAGKVEGESYVHDVLPKLLNLLKDVAVIGDTYSKPPDKYTLEKFSIPIGEYIKTGIYGD